MPASYFLDTNILIYTVGNVIPKKTIAVNLICPQAVISTQNISESINIMYRKLGYDYPQIRAIIKAFMDQMTLRIITRETIHSASNIAERYRYSYYDSQVIASALEHDCSLLYSEDLQHGQVIEGCLKIINPFF
jgi:predicted nucleic acid-binding protein